MKMWIAALFALGGNGLAFAEDAPKLPPRPPIEAYGKLPAIDTVALSPNGERLAFVQEKDSERYLEVYELKTHARATVKVEQNGEAKVRRLYWIDERYLVLTTAFVDHADSEYLWRGERNSTQIIDTEKTKAYNNKCSYSELNDYFPVSHNGKNHLLVSGGHGDLEYYDPEHNHCYPALAGTTEVVDWAVTPKVEPVGRALFYDSAKLWKLQLIKNGEWRTVLSKKVPYIDSPDLYGLGRNEHSVLISMAATDSEPKHYYEVDSDGQLGAPIEPAGYLTKPIYNPKTRLLAGFYTQGDEPKYFMYDADMGKIIDGARKALPDHRVWIVDWSKDAHKVVVLAEGPGDPGGYYFIDFDAKTSRGIGEPYPDVPSEWVAEQQPFTYKAADGLEIQGYITLPPGKTAKNLPAIVLPHDGPDVRDYRGFDSLAQALASRGYLVFQPNYRGSEGYGVAFAHKGWGEWGGKMQSDLSDGVRALAAQGLIDPKRVCIAGLGYGGYAALAGVTFEPGVYRCAASINGLSDLQAWMDRKITRTGGKHSDNVKLYERYLGDQTHWAAISPARFAAKATAPVLLVHGTDDVVSPPSQSKTMRDALKAAGKDVEYVELKGEDHWLSTEATRLEMLRSLIAFIEKHNPAD